MPRERDQEAEGDSRTKRDPESLGGGVPLLVPSSNMHITGQYNFRDKEKVV